MEHMQDCILCIYNYSHQRDCRVSPAGQHERRHLLWGDRSLDPSLSGQAGPSWYQKGSSLLVLVSASSTDPSTAPYGAGPSILQSAIWKGKTGPNSLWKLLAPCHSWLLGLWGVDFFTGFLPMSGSWLYTSHCAVSFYWFSKLRGESLKPTWASHGKCRLLTWDFFVTSTRICGYI